MGQAEYKVSFGARQRQTACMQEVMAKPACEHAFASLA